jgi:hypothetical protein
MDQQQKKQGSKEKFDITDAQPFLNEAYNTPSFVDFVDLDHHDRDANLFTHMQIHDSYREGTIDATIENSKNDVDSIPNVPYDM